MMHSMARKALGNSIAWLAATLAPFVVTALAARDIQTKLYFRPCHRMDAFFAFADEPLPATDHLFDHILCVPLYAELADQTIEEICGVVRAAAQTAAGVSARR